MEENLIDLSVVWDWIQYQHPDIRSLVYELKNIAAVNRRCEIHRGEHAWWYDTRGNLWKKIR